VDRVLDSGKLVGAKSSPRRVITDVAERGEHALVA